MSVQEVPSILPIEIGFLAEHGVPAVLLRRAAERADAEGVSADVYVIAEGLVSDVFFYRSLACKLNLPFSRARFDTRVGVFTWPALAAGVAALSTGGFVAAPRGRELALLLLQSAAGRAPDANLTITTPRHLVQAIFAAATAEIAHQVSFSLQHKGGHLSAAPRDIRRSRRHLWQSGFALLLVAAAIVPLGPTLVLSSIWSGLLFLSLAMRLVICGASAPPAPTRRRLRPADLPVYTVLVPLYRESRVLPKLIAALDALAYPRAKLQVLLLVEADDSETPAALGALALHPCYEIVTVPPGYPHTKPRALNVGLLCARGSLLTVYDAEDAPEPRQLRLAAEHFASAPQTLACLQARLAIFNVNQSWLTRLFAIEYATLFDVMNVGQVACGIPLPLGGTSNHFRVAALRAAGGWDAWNVTEDADLGFRLARFGYGVDVFASTTLEEAPESLRAWFPQRRRWCKGWLQTELTLTGTPRALFRDMGALRALATVGVLISLVVSPLLWPLSLVSFVCDVLIFGAPAPLEAGEIVRATLWTGAIVAGGVLTIWSSLLALKRRHCLPLCRWLLLLPVYNLLISAAAWAAIYDLVKAPYHWNKTAHGVTQAATPAGKRSA